MSVGQIAALVAAVAFVLLVLLLAVPLLKLGRTLDEATTAIRKAHEGTGPPLEDAGTTVNTVTAAEAAGTTLTAVDTRRERVDTVTTSPRAVAADTRALSTVLTATLGEPLVKVAALSYGLRKATQARRTRADAAAAAASRRSRRART